MNEETEKLAEMISRSRKTVFFGGAGVSTESGIPDFRSARGIYSEKYGELSPEKIVSASFYKAEPELFFNFYKEKLIYPDAGPNGAHYALAEMEKEGALSSIVTQNIDGLHSAAGAKRVIELHGSVHRNYCELCGKRYSLSFILASDGVPKCACGGTVRPDVTLYEEALPRGAFEEAAREVAESELLIVAGTSLSVYPAASLVRYLNGNLALINLTPTNADDSSDIVLRNPVGEVMSEVAKILGLRIDDGGEHNKKDVVKDRRHL